MTGTDTGEIEYTVRGPRTVQTVRGVQVGRLAVRKTSPRERATAILPNEDPRLVDTDPAAGFTRAFSVDHMPSGIQIDNCDTFDEAMRVADDISRFSVEDLDATEPRELVRQMGPRVCEWMSATRNHDVRPSYREWFAFCAEHEAEQPEVSL